MHQYIPGRRIPAALFRACSACVLASCLTAAGAPARAADGPSEVMMAPVRSLVAFMSSLPAGGPPPVFDPRGPCIVENFAPYLFCSRDAAARWESGLRAHFADEELAALAAEFGIAQDFSVTDHRAYFSLPTTWRGLTHGRRFEEHGAWAFVLERRGGGWRIKSYGWGVTSYTESAS